ncbi:hypothetical protein [Salmonella phage PKM.Hi.22.6]|uniref:Uncharacterized protein n=1 Tax=phage PKM.Lu.22.1 TaxID=3049197 RepID=A0AAF0RD01_9CAUD|nr:hypothetical protein [phage PKM.Lu.22.1]WKV17105.1 hypothetical protein [Salmonella phage PKM.Hi.22.6]
MGREIHVHVTWAIVTELGSVASLGGQLLIFTTEQDAIVKAASLIKDYPHRTFRVKPLTFEIPQQ